VFEPTLHARFLRFIALENKHQQRIQGGQKVKASIVTHQNKPEAGTVIVTSVCAVAEFKRIKHLILPVFVFVQVS
jgi:hypothetical protein